jgi:hypothetical protein
MSASSIRRAPPQFPFGAKGDEEGRGLDRFVGVVHDLGHRPAGVVRGEVFAGQDAASSAARCVGQCPAAVAAVGARATTWPQVAS